MSSVQKIFFVAFVVGGLVLQQGCAKNQNSLMNTVLQGGIDGSPFVEGYIEYPGPDFKWSGPKSMTVHVKAWEKSGFAQVIVYPVLFDELIPDVPGGDKARRQLSSTKESKDSKDSKDTKKPVHAANIATGAQGELSVQSVRERLGVLAHAVVKEPGRNLDGCLWPVRVRLIRQDGGVLEKQGCRSQLGWTETASHTAHYFIEAGIASAKANSTKKTN